MTQQLAAELSTELRYLIYTCIWLMVIWIPYTAMYAQVVSPAETFSYPDEGIKLPAWARRLKQAHYNLVENMAPFVVAVLAGEVIGLHTGTTAACALVFFLARVAHPFGQVSRIWGLRTLIFVVGWVAVLIYLLALLGVV
jgi:uncharacterized MAPEG superfamily protein